MLPSLPVRAYSGSNTPKAVILPQHIGVIGFPLRHTLSPIFQQAALDFYGLDIRYEAWETPPDRLPQVVASLRRPDRLGMNVTIPHKQAVAALLDRIDPVAAAIGAVNTVAKADGVLVGYNTDCTGFIDALRADGGFEPAGRSALVLGAGGSARAVVYGLLTAGALRVGIAARRPEAAVELQRAFAAGVGRDRTVVEPWGAAIEARLPAYDLVVNTTSMGMLHGAAAAESPLGGVRIPSGVLVYDLVYNPSETPLMRQARAAGARAAGGLSMLVYQGAVGFELWTGRKPPLELMMQAARRALYGTDPAQQ
ncbi:MAG: shikimate dehydrogenase [Dehalococcoidia bacterium]|nr:shikimate dehydrogenase [Dehalococcoidia bacterium]